MTARSEAAALYVPLSGAAQFLRTRVPRTPAYDQAIAKIHHLAEVPQGWDSYGGDAVSAAARQQALTFITSLLAHVDPEKQPPAPEVGPTVEGGVLLRWLTGDREIELVFLATGGDYTVRERSTGDVVDEGEIGSPESILRDVVRAHVVS